MAKTALIVDDSSSVRQIVKMVLTSSGFAVIEAENGQLGLDQLNGQKINLILSDVNMPVMDGIEFIKNIKELDEYKFTPILMLTTETSPELKAQAKEYGVKAWLVKPFRPALLLSAITKLT